MKIILASQSPRRKELLASLGYKFDVVSIDCEEILPENISTEEAVSYLSLLKSNAYKNLQPNEILITSDTIVVLDNTILGKPKDDNDAKNMLANLSGKTHQVYTGITVRSAEKTITETDLAEVEFDDINEQEIIYYLENYQPFDKAGSYGIQDWLGMAKIKKIKGSYYTIMGLPTHLVYKILQEFQ